jgi:hypothetical protein
MALQFEKRYRQHLKIYYLQDRLYFKDFHERRVCRRIANVQTSKALRNRLRRPAKQSLSTEAPIPTTYNLIY